MITRDAVQGFIDGWNAAQSGSVLSTPATNNAIAGNPQNTTPQLSDFVAAWLLNHPLYPQSQDLTNQIVADLGSYRNG